MRITLFPERETGGKTGGAFVVINDIEDDVRIRAALKAQDAQLRLFADHLPEPIAYLAKKLQYTFVNQPFANCICHPQYQFYCNPPYLLTPPHLKPIPPPTCQRPPAGATI